MADIRSTIVNHVCWIRFARPEVGNAVRGQTMRELCAALDAAENDHDVKAIVLAADGRHFVAGAEFGFLDQLRDMSATEVQSEVYAFFQGSARRVYSSTKPTIAAVQGAAITVGCELALMCDFRIVTAQALFQESWIKLGLLPPLGGMKLLPAMVGLPMARQMVLRARAVKGEEAVRIGLADQLVESDVLEAEVQALADELGNGPAQAYRHAKAGIARGLESTMDREWATNVMAQSVLIGTDDFGEGLDSVKAKRPPAFAGR